ncbi:MAG: branched-chain amino acid ABC transporter permease [Kiritimatiellales bacterium]|nr:branched-chain amino acid ABC transporter permease [Kiritimatiellales bacterium]MCF7864054.1 branched-chain amino acid ABC transporter permease [Kiritimatiellales bacterium]
MSPQYIVNAMAAGSLCALLAVGFSLVFMASRFFDFSLATVIVVPAYVLAFGVRIGAEQGLLCALFAIGVATLLTVALQDRLYASIISRFRSSWAPALSSLGVYTTLCGMLSLIFGDDVVSFPMEWSSTVYVIGGSHFTNAQMVAIVCVPLAILLVAVILKLSRIGKVIRGLASNEDLAVATGVSVCRVRSIAIGAGALVVSMSGFLAACDLGVTPHLGFGLLLNAVAAALLAGVGRFARTYFAALLIAGLQQWTAVTVGMEWSDAVTFAVLILGLAVIAPRFQRETQAGLAAP